MPQCRAPLGSTLALGVLPSWGFFPHSCLSEREASLL